MLGVSTQAGHTSITEALQHFHLIRLLAHTNDTEVLQYMTATYQTDPIIGALYQCYYFNSQSYCSNIDKSILLVIYSGLEETIL